MTALVPASPRALQATAATAQLPDTAALESRVKAYWASRQAKDLSGMYEFYSTDYRTRVSRDQFLASTRLVRFDLADVTVVGMEVTGDRAAVTVSYGLTVLTLGTEKLTSKSTESWIRERDGIWRKLDETLVVPFPSSLLPGPPGTSQNQDEHQP